MEVQEEGNSLPPTASTTASASASASASCSSCESVGSSLGACDFDEIDLEALSFDETTHPSSSSSPSLSSSSSSSSSSSPQSSLGPNMRAQEDMDKVSFPLIT